MGNSKYVSFSEKKSMRNLKREGENGKMVARGRKQKSLL
jgi:hypothetical protein